MLPLLKSLADGEEHKFSELVTQLGSESKLTEDELSRLLPSGTQEIFTDRVGWARLYLKKAGLLHAPKRGFLQITERGRSVLSENHERIDAKFLEQFPEFVAFKQRIPLQVRRLRWLQLQRQLPTIRRLRSSRKRVWARYRASGDAPKSRSKALRTNRDRPARNHGLRRKQG